MRPLALFSLFFSGNLECADRRSITIELYNFLPIDLPLARGDEVWILVLVSWEEQPVTPRPRLEWQT